MRGSSSYPEVPVSKSIAGVPESITREGFEALHQAYRADATPEGEPRPEHILALLVEHGFDPYAIVRDGLSFFANGIGVVLHARSADGGLLVEGDEVAIHHIYVPVEG